VVVEATLDHYTTDIKRQLTAYLISAVPTNQTLDIETNTRLDYRDTVAYTTYINTYNYVDTNICKVVDCVVNAEDLIKNFEEVISNENI
jgi:hypothetical protein